MVEMFSPGYEINPRLKPPAPTPVPSTNQALDAADDFLGPGYKDLGNGRFVSADGTRQVRMGNSDILGQHGGGPHMNFETLSPNPAKPGKMMIVEKMHIYLTD
jgi:hypothetical protein